MELTGHIKMARFQTFWIQMQKNKPLDKNRKSVQTSGMKMAFYSYINIGQCLMAQHYLPLKAARDNGALQQAKENLERQVKDLTQRLEQQTRLKTELEETLRAKEHEVPTKGSDMEQVNKLTAEMEKLAVILVYNFYVIL
ncbi:hypothetical protein Hanom_Chr01g00013451 [Helianthus anomalus]